MNTDLSTITRISKGQTDANEVEFRRLRELSLEERGRMLHAACQAAAQLVASRRAAGLPDPMPAPWPASTFEFLKRHAAHVRG
jgi:hypothetical protein